MKKNLFVTLANENFLDPAKQVFSSCYFNGNWDGDFMLLAHEVPENKLTWFKEKGILIKHCQELYPGKPGGMHPAILSKFYLFKTEFKKWQKIVYVDADTSVMGPLDIFLTVKQFAAVADYANAPVIHQISRNEDLAERNVPIEKANKLIQQIKKNYNVYRRSFCAGVFSLDTDMIYEDTFNQINILFREYESVSKFSEQLIWNLFFYKNWEKLPSACEIYIYNTFNPWRIKPKKIRGLIYHYVAGKVPWKKDNFYTKIWKYYLNKADEINPKIKKTPDKNNWTAAKIKRYSFYLDIKMLQTNIPHLIFQLGKYLKNLSFAVINKLNRKYMQNKKNRIQNDSKIS